MRKTLLLTVAALLLLSVDGLAQSCDGCGIGYRPSAVSTTSGGSSFFAGGISLGNTVASPYANLYGDAANTLALRNGANAQTFNIYNTYTDASNYERGKLYWTGNVLNLITEAAGTGTARNITINPGGTLTIASGSGLITTFGTIEGNSNDNANLGRVGVIAWKDLALARSIQGSKAKTLTDAAAAASVWSCAVPASDSVGGELIWTTESTDATDYRVTQGSIRFAGVNKAGTTTCTVGVIGTDLTASSNGNTLACTWTNVASGTNCLLSATCTDNTAGSQTMAVNSRLDMPIAQVCTPQ